MAEEDAASMDAEIDALLARHREYLHEGEPESADSYGLDGRILFYLTANPGI